ncbi:anti-sigma factor family protein [Natranaerobius trueperi]|uniref:Anti-sigma-W factor RsiW n=1 Tax=Natranaerobius trueperi TaxID=759412 RepID=A0A226BYP6_9FIRM|nr:zf-HC2 domain-containing protein [Natranaerobius trueperi]OWZ83319.1 hypothetical protein CDO51_09285 [Natranaerobius trueperi]
MDCNWILERLSSYVDNQLSPLDVKKVQKHLKYCDHCRDEFDQIRKVNKLVGSLDEISPSEDFLTDVISNTSNEEKQKDINTFINSAFKLKNVAAALIGIFLLGNGVLFALFEDISGEQVAEDIERELEISNSDQVEIIRNLPGGPYRTYVEGENEADVTMASSISQIDMSKYEENGNDDEETITKPFLIFNGMYLPLAVSTIMILKNRNRGE